ncbi:MAG: flagellar biosynthetic protein FliR [Bacillota bacterium]|nr:flagellar biosynthetic protein FliR [Bacillota bacterium]
MPFAMEGFLMIVGRISGLFLSAPIFASKQLPRTIKILIIVLLSAMMANFVPIQYKVPLENPALFLAAFIVEIFIGYCIGFVAYVVFAAIQLAGQLMDMQMGFAMVNVVDPQSGMQIPLMGNLGYLLALLIYLSMNGHHYLLQAVVQSYQVIPVLGVNLGSNFIDLIIQVTVYMFVIAVKISAPIVVSVMITDIAMGFIGRTVPQLNVFIVGLPLKIMIGLFALILFIPMFIWFMGSLFADFIVYLDALLFSMSL